VKRKSHNEILAALRDRALQTLDKPEKNEYVIKPGKRLRFDVGILPPPTTKDRFEATNGVATYPGQNSPHVGNGTGGPI
jgi:hypothetical protein